ncbi:signal peptidase II [Siculibacillus lacustris]|uniref:Lipoprotein signal peptidase n=1 Tax=Siculibacillus lacustris TaxID=1549641 RepID=A0A4Q9VFM0_9HYPH|nr:signal peptidase II [Siculibacillus lacustris]TBW32884.1 signal peptidase II [Siculibacillus lacustris]
MNRPWIWGLAAAVLGLAADQASKLWLLFGVRLGETGAIPLAPFAELRLIWNYGISYGLFQQDGDVGRWLLVALALVAAVAMSVWMMRAKSRVLALALGLIVGGAVGNAIDRAWWGAVVDFVHLFLPDRSRSWYVFNLADVWIVVGVIGLLYDSVVAGPKDATKSGSS